MCCIFCFFENVFKYISLYILACLCLHVYARASLSEDPCVESSDYPLTIKLFSEKQLLILHSRLQCSDRTCYLTIQLLTGSYWLYFALLLLSILSAAISTIDISADDPASSCPCLEGVPAYVLCVFLLPAASGSFLPFHHLLALRAARQLPSPSAQQLQFSVAASKCRTTS